ncbi:MAG: 50S ribosomal protein L10 [Candidatus Methylomirabilaceae bacterium]
MKRADKAAVIDDLKSLLAGAKAAVLAEHRGLTVAEVTDLRRMLRPQAVKLKIVKNSLARLATRGTAMEGLESHLTGPTLIAFGAGDPTLPARLLASYAKTKPTLQIKGGFLEGRVLGKQETLALAELPPREVLLARLAGVMRSPVRDLAVVLRGPLRALLMVLQAVGQKREQQAQRS